MAKATNNVETNNGLVKGASVNVTVKGEVFIATISEVIDGGKKFDVKFTDDSTMVVKASAVELRKRGRKSLEQTMSPAEIKAEVDALMTELSEAKTIDDKKRLRRLLRRRNHKGGLGLRPAPKA